MARALSKAGVLKVDRLNNPEVYTDDMSGWFIGEVM